MTGRDYERAVILNGATPAEILIREGRQKNAHLAQYKRASTVFALIADDPLNANNEYVKNAHNQLAALLNGQIEKLDDQIEAYVDQIMGKTYRQETDTNAVEA